MCNCVFFVHKTMRSKEGGTGRRSFLYTRVNPSCVLAALSMLLCINRESGTPAVRTLPEKPRGTSLNALPLSLTANILECINFGEHRLVVHIHGNR